MKRLYIPSTIAEFWYYIGGSLITGLTVHEKRIILRFPNNGGLVMSMEQIYSGNVGYYPSFCEIDEVVFLNTCQRWGIQLLNNYLIPMEILKTIIYPAKNSITSGVLEELRKEFWDKDNRMNPECYPKLRLPPSTGELLDMPR